MMVWLVLCILTEKYLRIEGGGLKNSKTLKAFWLKSSLLLKK